MIVTFVARSLWPRAWSRSGGAGRVRRGTVWSCGRLPGGRRCSRGSAGSRLGGGRRCQLGRGLAVGSSRDEQDSSTEEKANAEQGQPQRRCRLGQGRRRVVVVVVIVLVVAVRFVVRIAVATHAPLIFGFLAEVKQMSVNCQTLPACGADSPA